MTLHSLFDWYFLTMQSFCTGIVPSFVKTFAGKTGMGWLPIEIFTCFLCVRINRKYVDRFWSVETVDGLLVAKGPRSVQNWGQTLTSGGYDPTLKNFFGWMAILFLTFY